MKTKLFIDFDGTIFNTTLLKERSFVELRKSGFNDDELLSAYQAECLDYKFSLDDFLLRLAKIKEFNMPLAKARLEKLHKEIPEKFLFADSISFLGKIDHTKYEVNLISMGDVAFQKKKIEDAKISEYFDHVYVIDKQKWDYLKELVKKDERFVLLDDRADTIKKVAEEFPKALALEMCRKDEDHDDPCRNVGFHNNQSVRNLKQAMMYLE